MKKHIWESDIRYYCPLTGYCLTKAEQKQIVRKLNFDYKTLTERHIHSLLVRTCSTESSASRRIERLLNQKYNHEINQWQTWDEKTALAYAQNHLNHQSFGPMLWMIAVWADFSETVIDEIFSHLHLFTHTSFLAQQSLIDEKKSLSARFDAMQAKYLSLRGEADALKNERAQLSVQLQHQSGRIASLNTRIENLELENARQEKDKADKLKEKLEKSTRMIASLQQERSQLKEDLMAQNRDLNSMRDEMWDFLNRFENNQCDSADCPKYNLCERRVLVVGGLARLRSHYEKLVLDLGGGFDYHDGMCHNGESSLQHKIFRSDIVLCPVDVNSHAACLSVKKFSKKLNKSYFMLPNSSISTVYNKLQELAV